MAQHDDDTRAAVLAALLAGGSLRQVAAEYGVAKTTLIRWRDEAMGGPPGPDRSGPQKNGAVIADEQRRDLGARVGDYLDDILVTLRAQTIHARDKAWLGRQDAADLAILHGVFADKAIRLLSAVRTDTDLALDAPPA